MAKIQTVDYEKIPKQSQQMRDQGVALNREMTKAYESVTKMHNSWYGKRYNELVKSFNALIPQLNEMLQLVVEKFPTALDQVANNYAQADRGSNATSVNSTTAKKIQEVPTKDDIGMRFITSDVTSVQNQIKSNFDNSVDKMNQIESIYKGIVWESEAASSFKAKFTKLKAEIVKSFNEINKEFKDLMDKTVQDIESAEKANTVS